MTVRQNDTSISRISKDTTVRLSRVSLTVALSTQITTFKQNRPTRRGILCSSVSRENLDASYSIKYQKIFIFYVFLLREIAQLAEENSASSKKNRPTHLSLADT